MLKLIYGPKGFGKTKIILDDVNAAAKKAKGNVVLITDEKINSVDIDIDVRCVNTNEYDIHSTDAFEGFVKGLLAGNSDIEYLFIDGILRITNDNLISLEKFIGGLNKLNEENGLNIELTISSTKENLPKYLLSYLQ